MGKNSFKNLKQIDVQWISMNENDVISFLLLFFEFEEQASLNKTLPW